MKNVIFLLFIVLSTFLTSCDASRIFEENIDIKDHSWTYEDELFFEVMNNDLASKKMFINFRHSSLFPKRNLLLKVAVQNPKGVKEILDLNIPLSEPYGKWYGKCSGDICTYQHAINYEMSDTGKYVFGIVQDMRINPLQGAISIGIRVEKAEKLED